MLIAVIVVVGVFATSQLVFGERIVDPFSELAVLGPNMKIGDYPAEVFEDEPFTLHLYVGNQEGQVKYYSVLVKVGDASSTINASVFMDVPVLERFDSVLLSGENWTQPVSLSINEPATNLRLTFELWVLEETLQYDGRFCQIWMNVTKRPDF